MVKKACWNFAGRMVKKTERLKPEEEDPVRLCSVTSVCICIIFLKGQLVKLWARPSLSLSDLVSGCPNSSPIFISQSLQPAAAPARHRHRHRRWEPSTVSLSPSRILARQGPYPRPKTRRISPVSVSLSPRVGIGLLTGLKPPTLNKLHTRVFPFVVNFECILPLGSNLWSLLQARKCQNRPCACDFSSTRSLHDILRDGNGFKTSTMRLGANVIVFSCCCGDGGKSCVTMTHNAKTCMERPRKLGAKWTGKSIGPDQKVETSELDYNGKRDCWNGYDAALNRHVIKRMVFVTMKIMKML
ncbi:Pre-mRNA-splicing factor SLU7-A [Abeliophyllum distichum]|uniref:Pre-mRNA-splicing factor SLU7 n=1 Tax=Abeliophyllum distichum TaxID=126358 RepID=A0ABD1UFL1_9LAMI